MNDAKPVEFRGSALDDLRAFPLSARREAGHQLDLVQKAKEPDDWKPMGKKYWLSLMPYRYDLHRNRDHPDQAVPRPIEGVDPMSNQRFASVWDAIEDTPEEAENMKLRSTLMMALKSHIARTEMSQAQAAKLFGVTQPRVSDLMRGKINLFGLDALVNMAAAAGQHVEMQVLDAV